MLGITDYKENDEGYSYAEGLMFASGLLAPEVGKTGTSTIDIRIPSGISKINLYFEANNLRVLPTTDYIPRTFRILSASGALLPIEERTHLTHKKVHLRDECTETVSYIEHPAITTTFPERLRPIKTDNSKYCIEPAVATESSVADLESQGFSQQEIIEMKIMEELNNEANADIIQSGIDTTQQLLSDTKGQLIADGPVVVAEEPEKFSAFAAGKKRSRIVLISDASILQGACPEYRTENSANAQFIKSLYDKSSSMSKLRDSNTTIMDLDGGNLGSEYSGTTRGDGATRRILQNLEGGRQFEHIQKVISPERGSPQKFWAASGMAGLASKFGGGTARVSGSYFDSSDRDPKTVTRVPEPETLPLKKKEMSKFLALAAEAGANAKFHETVGSVVYRDRDAAGGMLPIVEALGRDHIDFDAYPSGYPGDLFGYSIALEGDRLIVGSPFNGFDSSNVIYWPEVSGFNKNNLTDISELISRYYEIEPELDDPSQLVVFGTSGHRGTSFQGSFTEDHIMAITQAICDYRLNKGINGPLFIGRDTHALSTPAFKSAIQVFAGNEVTCMIDQESGYTPTPVISHAILSYNRNKKTDLADGVVITPSHNPPSDGGFKYNPPNGGPADTDATNWIASRANELLHNNNIDVKSLYLTDAIEAETTVLYDYITPYVEDLKNVINMRAISQSSISICADAMGGAGAKYWHAIRKVYNLNLDIKNDVKIIDNIIACLKK